MKNSYLMIIILLLLWGFGSLLHAEDSNPDKEEMMKEQHQHLGIDLFNQSWDLLLKQIATEEDRKQFEADMNDNNRFGMR